MGEPKPDSPNQDNEMTTAEFEGLLEVKFVEIKPEDLHKLGVYRFVVADNFNVYITDEYHAVLFETHGIDPDAALIEGMVFVKDEKTARVGFKAPADQRAKGFKGSVSEMDNFKSAVNKKIRALL